MSGDIAARASGEVGTEGGGDRIRVLGIAGSLRSASFNRALLRAAGEQAPPAIQLIRFGIDDLPLYNADLDVDEARPASVRTLKSAIAEADAVLLATPEYNHSVPGVLQNALDWASRPGMRSPLRGKPVGLMGASTSLIGTARAQQQLKLVMASMLALVMPHPGVLVVQAGTKFDDEGALTHQPTREFLASYMADFEAWVRRLSSSRPALPAP